MYIYFFHGIFAMKIRAWSSLPELENSTSVSYFSKPEPKKNPISKDRQIPNSKKTPKVETWSNPFLNYKKSRQVLNQFS